MEIFSPEDQQTSTNSNGNMSGLTRKRKLSTDTDIENQRPTKRREQFSPVPSSDDNLSDATQTSLDYYATAVDCDFVCLFGSPSSSSANTAESVIATNLLSPTINDGETSWTNRGDKTPQTNKKRSNCSMSSCCVSPMSELRACPLPNLSWANSSSVWRLMCRKDERAWLDRDPNMLSKHPSLLPRMRAILLDWLIEVCEVYKLHRETYYLALDYLDRYLSCSVNVSKTRLQLIGITCLFVAAKVEEIYPPKIGEFAYVTDGACTEENILQQELLILQSLNWSINPVTITGWLSIYMQLNETKTDNYMNKNRRTTNRQLIVTDTPTLKSTVTSTSTPISAIATTKADKMIADSKNSDAFIYSQFSGMKFSETAQLVDLCTLDLGIINFPYSVIAAAAISHVFDRATAMRVSGLDWDSIRLCAEWMESFYHVIREDSTPIFLLEQNEQVKSSYGLSHVCPNMTTDDSHTIQTHNISLDMFDKVINRREQDDKEKTPIVSEKRSPAGLLTPPASSRKSIEITNPESEIKDNTKTSK